MTLNYFDGRCYVLNSAHGQVAGRTPEQAQRTANRLATGNLRYDADGIGYVDISEPLCLYEDIYDQRNPLGGAGNH
jgi:hypothetical protein